MDEETEQKYMRGVARRGRQQVTDRSGDAALKRESGVLCLGSARPAEAKLLVQSHMLLI